MTRQRPMRALPSADTVRDLERALVDAIEGDVRFDTQARALYATDASNYRQVPIGVVQPRSTEDVIRAVALCRERGVPVLGRGGGTSLAGQCCNAAVVFDFSRHLNRVLDIDRERRLARVEPGCVLDTLRHEARRHGLTFGPDPATHDHCAIGGMIGNNSCGPHSVAAQWHTGPRTSDNVHRLKVLTYDGAHFWTGPTDESGLERILRGGGRQAEIARALLALRDDVGDEIRARYPDIPRRVSGYNLDELLPENGFHLARALVGSESTCVLVLEAEVHLIPEPKARALLVAGYPDVYRAADQVPLLMERRPIALEGLDHRLIGYLRKRDLHADDLHLLPDGHGFLLAEFGGETRLEAIETARQAASRLRSQTPRPNVAVLDDEADQAAIWEIRESGLGATAFVPGESDTWPGWEDSAVRPEQLGSYLRDLRALLDRHGYDGAFYGHFGHGLVHCRIDFELSTAPGIERFVRFLHDAADLVVRYGGSLSGEHGDGQARASLLERMFGARLIDAFRRFKAIWDPDGGMNPGKVVDPYGPGEHLRLDWEPREPQAHFSLAAEGGTMTRAALRCVGVGKCRRESGGTMCPSYMVTHDEAHSTRGRSRLLYEMLRGEVIEDGWKSEEVKEALDLCLACKGCKGDCPVSVDMATYKAEFASHYFAGRLRPRAGYALGRIRTWARLGSAIAPLANWVIRTQPLEGMVKLLGGIHHDRQLPPLSHPSFDRRFSARTATRVPTRGEVVFWPDTFNRYFHAETAMAGIDVLERLGFQVTVPKRPLCCGRPLYDFGWLEEAKRGWLRILNDLEEVIRRGVPIVGLEPSCVAAFRDELPNLLPDDARARKLAANTVLLAEFLDRHGSEVELPERPGRVLLHGHCHEKAVLDWPAERRILERLGATVDAPETGCCGMAGAFGFEADHYDVAQACGERVLLPAVRNRESTTPVVANGFSCREMIAQNTGVRALNLAEVLQQAFVAAERGGGSSHAVAELGVGGRE